MPGPSASLVPPRLRPPRPPRPPRPRPDPAAACSVAAGVNAPASAPRAGGVVDVPPTGDAAPPADRPPLPLPLPLLLPLPPPPRLALLDPAPAAAAPPCSAALQEWRTAIMALPRSTTWAVQAEAPAAAREESPDCAHCRTSARSDAAAASPRRTERPAAARAWQAGQNTPTAAVAAAASSSASVGSDELAPRRREVSWPWAARVEGADEEAAASAAVAVAEDDDDDEDDDEDNGPDTSVEKPLFVAAAVLLGALARSARAAAATKAALDWRLGAPSDGACTVRRAMVAAATRRATSTARATGSTRAAGGAARAGTAVLAAAAAAPGGAAAAAASSMGCSCVAVRLG